MTGLLDQFQMKTNFEGLIQLVAKSLYSEPDVFIRELIQNAHDSILLRKNIESDVSGHIDIILDVPQRSISVKDNGLGMDRQDIMDFLSVIGSSGTGAGRDKLEQEGIGAAYELIGQFGIGMLSAYVVAEKIVVRTRKLGAEEAFAWHNSGSMDCLLYSDDKPDVGTEIIVFIRPEYSFLVDRTHLQKVMIKYCDFIPFPITLNGSEPVNTQNAPWHRTQWDSAAEKEASYRRFLNHRYPDFPLEVIPVEIDTPYRARGALYISDRRIPDISSTGVVDIFVRRMFVIGNDTTLLPPWAKFVRGVIDSPDLQITTSRDNIQRGHPSFDFLQKRLGELIVERLTFLASRDPEKFKRINIWHHYHLKGMAWVHDDFYRQVVELLLFRTNKGEMSLKKPVQINTK